MFDCDAWRLAAAACRYWPGSDTYNSQARNNVFKAPKASKARLVPELAVV
jgi:hypothetical protein